MQGRYRKAGEVAGQLFIAVTLITGIVLCATLMATLMYAAMAVGS